MDQRAGFVLEAAKRNLGQDQRGRRFAAVLQMPTAGYQRPGNDKADGLPAGNRLQDRRPAIQQRTHHLGVIQHRKPRSIPGRDQLTDRRPPD